MVRGCRSLRCSFFARGCSLFSVRVPLRLFARKQTTKLSQLAASVKAANEATERWHQKVKEYREECIELPKDQGDAVDKFLIDQETRELLDKKLPPKSEHRALLNVRLFLELFLWFSPMIGFCPSIRPWSRGGGAHRRTPDCGCPYLADFYVRVAVQSVLMIKI